MKYPSIGKQPVRNISIPELSGGLNLRDGISAVNDDQLTQCLNMWFKGGLLKTRPGLSFEKTIECDDFKPEHNVGQMISNLPQKENVAKTKHNKQYVLVTQRTDFFHLVVSGGEWYPSYSHIQAFYISNTLNNTVDIERLPSITTEYGTTYDNHFVLQQKNTLYCFCETENGGDIYRLSDGDTEWAKLSNEDIYAPIIMTNCLPSGNMNTTQQDLLDSGGVMFEGYNLLGNRCRRIWSTFNRKAANVTSDTDTTKRHFMYYTLLNTVAKFPGETIAAEITDKNGEVYVHKVTIPETFRGWTVESTDPGDGLYMGVFRNFVGFFTAADSTSSVAYVTENDYVENNMVITEPCENSSDSLKKVFGMTQRVWFGGDAAGISGGSRLFLGGNASEKEKSLVLWSGLNNPLYFPENCYAYVGNSNQAVTAFGRQSDMLVIFKERETFLTQYVRNDNITAEDLIDQKVVDYTASNVYFPIIQLHAGIGCDCPDTVQLCRNCLVWACTDGNVYTLRSENQYSERTIFKVSDMVSRELKELVSSYARSADVDGKYYLFCGNKVFVMDYESYGYVYVSSYSKTEDAQLHIPWWYWELPVESCCIAALDNTLIALEEKIGKNYLNDYQIYKFSEDETEDYGNAIKSALQTKIFDFGTPAYAKNVPLVNIAFGNNGGNPVTVAFVSDRGDSGTEDVVLSESDSDEYSPEYVHNRQLRPSAHGITRFGVKLECDGVMSIDGISLNYRVLGGAR